MEKNLCLLIDFENIAAGTEKDGLGRFDVNLVLERLADKGRVLIARSYADWGRFARFKQGLLTSNVSMMELTSHGMQDKNRADIALVVEGMELAFTKPYIDTFVIVSGDSDFTPMVLKMRELDKRVIGCGCRSSTSRLLIQACDEFIFYDNLAKQKKSRRAKQSSQRSKGGEPNLAAAFELLSAALEGLQRENPDPPHASVVKSAMLRKSPDFSENDLGFSSLARFLERARKQGLVKLIRDEKSGGYRVDQVGSGDGDDGPSPGGGRRGGAWLDPYLPKDTEPYVEILASEGLNPLAAPTRKAILECLEEIVEFREKKKRRVTVHFVQDDTIKRLRKTHPDVPHKAIRNVFNGLMRANAFIHRDGNPVRTGSAQFGLNKTAEELNETLADIYIYELIGNGAKLEVGPIAELLYGDASRTRPVEESIAYHQANAAEVDDDDDAPPEVPDLDALDVDSLLLADDDDGDAPADDKGEDEAEAMAKPEDKSEAAPEPSDDDKRAAAAEAQESEEAPPATKKKTSRAKTTKAKAPAKKVTATRRKTTKKTEEAETEAAAEAPAEEAPKKRRRVRKKPAAKAPEAEAKSDDLDALLSED